MDKYKTIKRLDECDEKEIKELLIGRKVKVEGDNLILDNGIILEVIANEGCGGCSNGWYSITKLNEVDNAITDVQLIHYHSSFYKTSTWYLLKYTSFGVCMCFQVLYSFWNLMWSNPKITLVKGSMVAQKF